MKDEFAQTKEDVLPAYTGRRLTPIPLCEMVKSITRVGDHYRVLFMDGYTFTLSNEDDAKCLARVYSVEITDKGKKAREWAYDAYMALAAEERRKEQACMKQGYDGMAKLHRQRAEDLERRARK